MKWPLTQWGLKPFWRGLWRFEGSCNVTKQKQDFEFAILKKNQWENQCEKWLHLLFNNLLGKLGKTLFSNEVTKHTKICWRWILKNKKNTLLTIDRRVGGMIEKNCKYISVCVCVGVCVCVWNWCQLIGKLNFKVN